MARVSRAGVAEAKLFGTLQRVIDQWRFGATEAAEEARANARGLWREVEAAGGDPAAVVAYVWGREVNADVARDHDQVDVLGQLGG